MALRMKNSGTFAFAAQYSNSRSTSVFSLYKIWWMMAHRRIPQHQLRHAVRRKRIHGVPPGLRLYQLAKQPQTYSGKLRRGAIEQFNSGMLVFAFRHIEQRFALGRWDAQKGKLASQVTAHWRCLGGISIRLESLTHLLDESLWFQGIIFFSQAFTFSCACARRLRV